MNEHIPTRDLIDFLNVGRLNECSVFSEPGREYSVRVGLRIDSGDNYEIRSITLNRPDVQHLRALVGDEELGGKDYEIFRRTSRVIRRGVAEYKLRRWFKEKFGRAA
jgi:hypothetical protein